MASNWVEENGEVALGNFLATQGHEHNFHVLQCCFFQAGINPPADDLRHMISSVSNPDLYKVYLCKDGDIFVQWTADLNNAQTKETIKTLINEHFGAQINAVMSADQAFIEYSMPDNISALKAECFKKQGRMTKGAKEIAQHMQNAQLISTFKSTIQLISMQRMMRVNPHILIVEDQAFSQKILLSALKDYTCYVADTTGDAMVKYMEKCPDIVLLDVDLPDISGHSFARFLQKIDPHAYVVMVTANQYESDVKEAKENNAMGFIPKPYKKEAILGVIDKFKIHRKKKTS